MSGPRPIVLAALVALAPALAGCASNEASVSLDTLSLGTIAGTVTDAGLTPLAGAVVRLDGRNDSVSTDATGAFAFTAPPGEYLVLATLDGYRGGALRAAPGPGETARLAFALSLIPRERPDIVVAEQHGLISCGATVIVGEEAHPAACGGNDPNQRTRVAFTVGPTHGLAGAVVEVVWEPHSEAASWFEATVLSGEGDATAEIAGAAGERHVVISIPGRVLEGVITDGSTLVVDVAPTGSLADEEAGVDGGAVVQQEFTVYLSLFYFQTQPVGYSVVGES